MSSPSPGVVAHGRWSRRTWNEFHGSSVALRRHDRCALSVSLPRSASAASAVYCVPLPVRRRPRVRALGLVIGQPASTVRRSRSGAGPVGWYSAVAGAASGIWGGPLRRLVPARLVVLVAGAAGILVVAGRRGRRLRGRGRGC